MFDSFKGEASIESAMGGPAFLSTSESHHGRLLPCLSPRLSFVFPKLNPAQRGFEVDTILPLAWDVRARQDALRIRFANRSALALMGRGRQSSWRTYPTTCARRMSTYLRRRRIVDNPVERECMRKTARAAILESPDIQRLIKAGLIRMTGGQGE